MHSKLFPSQQPNEKIYLIFREHWFRLFVKLFIVAIFASVPTVISMSSFNLATILPMEITSQLVVLLNVLYYLAILLVTFIIWVLYYLNMGIVSEYRLVDIDQKGLLKHEVSELNLDAIEDVTSETIGLFGNILDYGTVYIQTAGATERFEFDKIHHPKKVAGIILSLYEQRKKDKPAK